MTNNERPEVGYRFCCFLLKILLRPIWVVVSDG